LPPNARGGQSPTAQFIEGEPLERGESSQNEVRSREKKNVKGHPHLSKQRTKRYLFIRGGGKGDVFIPGIASIECGQRCMKVWGQEREEKVVAHDPAWEKIPQWDPNKERKTITVGEKGPDKD